MKVLIAEDSALERLALQSAVGRLGHACLVASDGEEAWRVFQTTQVDVVISDWVMPGIDGPDLCRLVRAQFDAPYVYFLLLTVLDDKQHAIEGMLAGADDYLTKPLNLLDLQARLIAAERVTAQHRRGEAQLRLAQYMAAEADPERILERLLDEAVRLVGGDAGAVYRWDEARSALLLVRSVLDVAAPASVVHSGEGAVGLAVEQRKPVVVDAHTSADTTVPWPAAAGIRAAAATPLLHEGRILGSLVAAARDPEKHFRPEDVETLELLAGVASAALVSIERAQLQAVALAARELAHLLGNDLMLAVGFVDVLKGQAGLEGELGELIDEAAAGLAAASRRVEALQRVVRVVTKETPVGPALDLERSAQPPRP
jgi:CheY-like chemotaxis protein